MNVLEIQLGLLSLGFDSGPKDGAMGPRTRAAIKQFQKTVHLVADGIPGPKTLLAMDSLTEMPYNDGTPPWMEEMLRRKGLHEDTDHHELKTWLKSAGKFVDPAETPWCGDAVETAILRSLPDAIVPADPMAAISWLRFGVELEEPSKGAIMVFWRGDPSSWKGHVGFYAGEDDLHYFILGGNQSNEINVTRLNKVRLRPKGIRWPNNYPLPTTGRFQRGGNNAVTTNEE